MSLWRSLIVAFVVVAACGGQLLAGGFSTAPNSRMVYSVSTAGAGPDTVSVTPPTGYEVEAKDSTAVAEGGNPGTMVRTGLAVTSATWRGREQGYGCAYTLTGIWTKTPPGGSVATAGTNNWASQYDYTQTARIGLSVSPTAVGAGQDATATVTLFGGDNGKDYTIALSSEAPEPSSLTRGSVTFPDGGSVTLKGPGASTYVKVRGGSPGYLTLTATCGQATNSPQKQPMTVLGKLLQFAPKTPPFPIRADQNAERTDFTIVTDPSSWVNELAWSWEGSVNTGTTILTKKAYLKLKYDGTQVGTCEYKVEPHGVWIPYKTEQEMLDSLSRATVTDSNQKPWFDYPRQNYGTWYMRLDTYFSFVPAGSAKSDEGYTAISIGTADCRKSSKSGAITVGKPPCTVQFAGNWENSTTHTSTASAGGPTDPVAHWLEDFQAMAHTVYTEWATHKDGTQAWGVFTEDLGTDGLQDYTTRHSHKNP